MQYIRGAIFLVFAKIDLVDCITFGNLLGWFKNSFNIANAATARDCVILKNRRKCKFDTKSLKLDSDKAVEVIVNTDGRKIKCNKLFQNDKANWHGSCDGNANDVNFIVRFDKIGRQSIFGSIHVGNEICQFGPNILGQEEIQCIPRSEFQLEDDPRDVPNVGSLGKIRLLGSDTKFGFIPEFDPSERKTLLRGKLHLDDGRQLFDNSGGNIDIMVVWTKLAECRKAGLKSGCTVNATTENMMRGLIDLAIAETNTAYALSGIFTALRLVHAYREPDYVEGDDMYTSLGHITTPNDGFMDSVHSARALYGADVVHMIAGAGNSCGIAWSGNPSIDYMFGVTNYVCATGYYSFGHEIGHNLGMLHDRGSGEACSETTTFNYGFRDPRADFRTILSYDCKMAECDLMPKNGCPRIQRFSNSNSAYTYNGKSIGDPRSDNAKQLNNVRALVASFFPAMNCVSDKECNDSNSNTTDTCNTVNRVCIFTQVDAPTRIPSRSPTTPAPVETVDEPISGQEQRGFFSMILQSLGDFLLRLFSRR